VRYLCTTREVTGDLSEALMRRGIYQVLALESGHIAPAFREAVAAVFDRLYVPLEG
jgi:hypothetical protein